MVITNHYRYKQYEQKKTKEEPRWNDYFTKKRLTAPTHSFWNGNIDKILEGEDSPLIPLFAPFTPPKQNLLRSRTARRLQSLESCHYTSIGDIRFGACVEIAQWAKKEELEEVFAPLPTSTELEDIVEQYTTKEYTTAVRKKNRMYLIHSLYYETLLALVPPATVPFIAGYGAYTLMGVPVEKLEWYHTLSIGFAAVPSLLLGWALSLPLYNSVERRLNRSLGSVNEIIYKTHSRIDNEIYKRVQHFIDLYSMKKDK